MRVDLPQADTWYEASERARSYLGIADDPNLSVHVYLGVRHALWEITQALAHTFAHRRMIGYTPFSGPEGEFVALQFAKEGFTVKSLSQDEIASPKAWMETASKQMLCLLSAYDDPATGEIFLNQNLSDALKDQRIFRILVSHSYHEFFELGKVGPYDIQVLSLETDVAIAVLGERAKLTPPVAANLNWSNFTLKDKLNRKSQEQILSFESALSDFRKINIKGFDHFQAAKNLPDRAILFTAEVEGLSLASRLSQKLGVNLVEQGGSSDLETLSLCRWQDPRQLEWLTTRNLSVERLRGSIIISSELLVSKGVKKVAEALVEARNELVKEQG